MADSDQEDVVVIENRAGGGGLFTFLGNLMHQIDSRGNYHPVPSSDVERGFAEDDNDDEQVNQKKKDKKDRVDRPDLSFNEFFEEEESTYTNPKILEFSEIIYRYTKLGFYNILMVIVGIPVIVIWGIILSTVSFGINWIYDPILKVIIWVLNTTLPLMEPLKEVVGGCCMVIGKCFPHGAGTPVTPATAAVPVKH